MNQAAPGSTLVGKRILVVEDEALLADELVAELEAAGAVPSEASSGIAQTLQTLDNNHFDAAILNVWLRRQLSFPVAEALRERGIPFIFVTGSGHDATQQYPDIISHPKPADMKAVVKSLTTLISRREAGKADTSR